MQEKLNHQYEKPQTERQSICCPVAVPVLIPAPVPVPVSSTVQPSTSTKWESKKNWKGYYLERIIIKNKKQKKWKDTSLKIIKKITKRYKK